MINSNDYMKHTHDSSSLRTYDQIPIGTPVLCQNICNRKWDRMGYIVETLKFRPY